MFSEWFCWLIFFLLVVEDKWVASIERRIKTEMERISQRLTERIKELAEGYETPLPKLELGLSEVEAKVNKHLEMIVFGTEAL